MKESTRLAGLFASVSFMFIAIPSYLATNNPVHALLYGLGGSIILGAMGFKLGDILDNPKKPTKKKKGKPPKFLQELFAPPGRNRQRAEMSMSSSTPSHHSGLTGEETLLDELDTDS